MDSFYKIGASLEKHHGIFSQIWQMGVPQFTDQIDTACVTFNREGGFISFLFNEEFWNKLNDDERACVVAHECLHVILNHGKRMKGLHPQIANMTLDVVVNEMLVNSFGFDRNLPVFLGEQTSGPACFINTVFKDRKDVAERREFEYYYGKLMDQAKKQQEKQKGKGQPGSGGSGGEPGEYGMGEGDAQPIDSHEELPQEILDQIQRALNRISDDEIEKLAEAIDRSGEKDKTNEEEGKAGDGKPQSGGKQAGKGSGFNWIRATIKPRRNKKWEQIVKKYVIHAFANREREQWVKRSRRFAILEASSNFLIPADSDTDDIDITRIDVVFFMDVSGSCHGDSQKFFAAARSVPLDKFKLDAFAFDTGIINVNLEQDKLPMGGGTSFHHLEEFLAKRTKYPSLVFMLTDGYGTDISPKHPERWHVFLTADAKHNFHKDMHFHKFTDVE